MMWAGISVEYRSDLRNFRRDFQYRDEVLESTGRLYAVAFGPGFISMEDNACPQRTVLVEDYLVSKGLRV